MSRQAQQLLTVTNADSHDLIRQSLTNLNNRVQSLEGQAREQGEKLRTVDRNYKSYKVWPWPFVWVIFNVRHTWAIALSL